MIDLDFVAFLSAPVQFDAKKNKDRPATVQTYLPKGGHAASPIVSLRSPVAGIG